MFVNNINPTLFKIGIFQIRYYGIIYALGFIIAYFFLRYYIKKGRLKDITVHQLEDFMLYLLIGVVAGARLFEFIFYHPGTFWTDPLEILKVWHGGLSFHGGLIGAIISILIFSKRYKIKWTGLLDALVVPTSLALAFGRIANFTNQELYGTVTNVPWCVQFTAVDNLCRHPYQIYASLTHLLAFAILIFIYKYQKKEGTAFWSFVLLYGGLRVITDFFRVEDRAIGQILSLIMFITALAVLLIRKRKLNL